MNGNGLIKLSVEDNENVENCSSDYFYNSFYFQPRGSCETNAWSMIFSNINHSETHWVLKSEITKEQINFRRFSLGSPLVSIETGMYVCEIPLLTTKFIYSSGGYGWYNTQNPLEGTVLLNPNGTAVLDDNGYPSYTYDSRIASLEVCGCNNYDANCEKNCPIDKIYNSYISDGTTLPSWEDIHDIDIDDLGTADSSVFNSKVRAWIPEVLSKQNSSFLGLQSNNDDSLLFKFRKITMYPEVTIKTNETRWNQDIYSAVHNKYVKTRFSYITEYNFENGTQTLNEHEYSVTNNILTPTKTGKKEICRKATKQDLAIEEDSDSIINNDDLKHIIPEINPIKIIPGMKNNHHKFFTFLSAPASSTASFFIQKISGSNLIPVAPEPFISTDNIISAETISNVNPIAIKLQSKGFKCSKCLKDSYNLFGKEAMFLLSDNVPYFLVRLGNIWKAIPAETWFDRSIELPQMQILQTFLSENSIMIIGKTENDLIEWYALNLPYGILHKVRSFKFDNYKPELTMWYDNHTRKLYFFGGANTTQIQYFQTQGYDGVLNLNSEVNLGDNPLIVKGKGYDDIHIIKVNSDLEIFKLKLKTGEITRVLSDNTNLNNNNVIASYNEENDQIIVAEVSEDSSKLEFLTVDVTVNGNYKISHLNISSILSADSEYYPTTALYNQDNVSEQVEENEISSKEGCNCSQNNNELPSNIPEYLFVFILLMFRSLLTKKKTRKF